MVRVEGTPTGDRRLRRGEPSDVPDRTAHGDVGADLRAVRGVRDRAPGVSQASLHPIERGRILGARAEVRGVRRRDRARPSRETDLPVDRGRPRGDPGRVGSVGPGYVRDAAAAEGPTRSRYRGDVHRPGRRASRSDRGDPERSGERGRTGRVRRGHGVQEPEGDRGARNRRRARPRSGRVPPGVCVHPPADRGTGTVARRHSRVACS